MKNINYTKRRSESFNTLTLGQRLFAFGFIDLFEPVGCQNVNKAINAKYKQAEDYVQAFSNSSSIESANRRFNFRQ